MAKTDESVTYERKGDKGQKMNKKEAALMEEALQIARDIANGVSDGAVLILRMEENTSKDGFNVDGSTIVRNVSRLDVIRAVSSEIDVNGRHLCHIGQKMMLSGE